MKKEDYLEAEDYYEMGCQWIEQKEYLKAVESFRRVITLNHGFIYAYIDLAYAFSKMKRYHEALQVLRKGVHHDPGFHRLHYLMAKYAFRDGDYQSALKYIAKASELSDERLYKLVHDVILKKHESGR